MCIIMYKEAGVEIKDEWMKNSAKSNPDGFGMSYIEGGKLCTFRCMGYEEFVRVFREKEVENPESKFLLHFRKNTKGTNSIENCHPFSLKGNLAMMHNGSIGSIDVPLKCVDSDTNLFAKKILDNLPDGWLQNQAILDLVSNFIGGSKLTIMDEAGEVTFINKKAGHMHEGVWMSNYSYYPNTKSIQKTKPLSWESNKNNKRNIFKQKDGTYTTYINGVHYVWEKFRHLWKPSGAQKTDFNTPLMYHSSPDPKFDNLIIVGKKNKTTRDVVVYDSNTKKFKCAYCEGLFSVSDLEVCKSDYESLSHDIYCEDCVKELESVGVVVRKPGYSVLYFAEKYANSWS